MDIANISQERLLAQLKLLQVQLTFQFCISFLLLLNLSLKLSGNLQHLRHLGLQFVELLLVMAILLVIKRFDLCCFFSSRMFWRQRWLLLGFLITFKLLNIVSNFTLVLIEQVHQLIYVIIIVVPHVLVNQLLGNFDFMRIMMLGLHAIAFKVGGGRVESLIYFFFRSIGIQIS